MKTLRFISDLAGFRGSPLSSGEEFSWQKPQEEPITPPIDRERMKDIERRAIISSGGTPREDGESLYPPSSIKRPTLDTAKLWKPGDGGPPSQGSREGTPDLNRHFVHYTVMRDFPDIVFDSMDEWSRFVKAPHELQAEIRNTLEKRELYAETAEELRETLQTVREQNQSRVVAKIERQIKHREMMVKATEEELKVAFFFGPAMESFDRNNPGGKRPKFRTDAETADFMVEVTIGRSKRPAQLNDYVHANDKERHLIMHAPRMEANWAQQAVLKRGFKLSRSYDELFDIVETIKRGPKI